MDELTRMMALCSRREYSEYDISEKLMSRGVEAEEAAKILQQLRRGKYVDDRRYAEAFVRDKSTIAGWGAKKIAFHLTMKRIAKEIIDSALKEADTEKGAIRMNDILALKWKQLAKEENPSIRRQKLFRFALGRGYSYSDVARAIDLIDK